jgi:penicillin-insensitive murein endopeptidase
MWDTGMKKLTILHLIRIFLIVPLVLAFGVSAAEAKKKAAPKKKHAVARASSPIAKDIFGHQTQPSPAPARAIGFYAKGCLAGGVQLAETGPTWQAMRLSRNRHWAHPVLISYLKRLAADAKKNDGWPGLLVGDLSQPKGGPMLAGHASHQIGLDADIWLKPMPAKLLTRAQRETEAFVSMLAKNGVEVDPNVWTPQHFNVIKRAASYRRVARIFVHPAIKKALCDGAGKDRKWLSKIRPYWGHNSHFHVRLSCPAGMKGCKNQPGGPFAEGCGKELKRWLAKVKPRAKPAKLKKPKKPKKKPSKPVRSHRKQLTIAQLPRECARLVGIDPNAKVARVPMGPGGIVPLPVRKPRGGVAVRRAATPKVLRAKAAR